MRAPSPDAVAPPCRKEALHGGRVKGTPDGSGDEDQGELGHCDGGRCRQGHAHHVGAFGGTCDGGRGEDMETGEGRGGERREDKKEGRGERGEAGRRLGSARRVQRQGHGTLHGMLHDGVPRRLRRHSPGRQRRESSVGRGEKEERRRKRGMRRMSGSNIPVVTATKNLHMILRPDLSAGGKERRCVHPLSRHRFEMEARRCVTSRDRSKGRPMGSGDEGRREEKRGQARCGVMTGRDIRTSVHSCDREGGGVDPERRQTQKLNHAPCSHESAAMR